MQTCHNVATIVWLCWSKWLMYCVGLSSPHSRRMEHWYSFLNTAIINDVSSYLCSLLTLKVAAGCNFWSPINSDCGSLDCLWSKCYLKLHNNLSLDYFKTRIKDHMMSLCTCFTTECCKFVNWWGFLFNSVYCLCLKLFCADVLAKTALSKSYLHLNRNIPGKCKLNEIN